MINKVHVLKIINKTLNILMMLLIKKINRYIKRLFRVRGQERFYVYFFLKARRSKLISCRQFVASRILTLQGRPPSGKGAG